MTIIKPFKAGKGLAPTVRNISTLGNDIPDTSSLFRDEELTFKQDNAMTGDILLTLLEALRQFRVQSGGNISVSNNTTVIRNNICSIVNNYRSAAGGSGSVSLNLLLQNISDAFSSEAPSQQSTELLINRLSEQLGALGITPTKRNASVSEIRNGNTYHAGTGRTAEMILKKNADLSGEAAFYGDIIGNLRPQTANENPRESSPSNGVSPRRDGSRGGISENRPLREKSRESAPEPKEHISYAAPKAPENRLADIFPTISGFFADISRYETHTIHTEQNNTEFRDNSRIAERPSLPTGSADTAGRTERGISGAFSPDNMPSVPSYPENPPSPTAPAAGGDNIYNAAYFLSSNFYSDLADTFVGAFTHIGGQTVNAPEKSVFAEYTSAQSVTGAAAFFGNFVSNHSVNSFIAGSPRESDRAFVGGDHAAASELILLNSYINTEYERFLRGDKITREEAVYHIFQEKGHSPAEAGKTALENSAAQLTDKSESGIAAYIRPEAAAKSYGFDVGISKLPEASAEFHAGFVGGNVLPHTEQVREELFYLRDGAPDVLSGGISPSESPALSETAHGAAENTAATAPQYSEAAHGAPAEEHRGISKIYRTDLSENTAVTVTPSYSQYSEVMESVLGDIFRTVRNSAVNNDFTTDNSSRNYSVGGNISSFSDKFTELNFYRVGDREQFLFGGNNTSTELYTQSQSASPAPQKLQTDIFLGTELTFSHADTLYSSLFTTPEMKVERPAENAPSQFTQLFRTTNSYVSEIPTHEQPQVAPAGKQGGAAVGAVHVSGGTVKLAAPSYSEYSEVMTRVFGDIFRTVKNSAVNNDFTEEISSRNYSVGWNISSFSDKFTELNFYRGGDRPQFIFGGNNTSTELYSQNQSASPAPQKLQTDIFLGTELTFSHADTLYSSLYSSTENKTERPAEIAPSQFTQLFRTTNSYVSEISTHEQPQSAPADKQGGAAVGAVHVSGGTVKPVTPSYSEYSEVMTRVFGDIFRTVKNSAVNSDLTAELSSQNYSVRGNVNRFSDKFTELNYYSGGSAQYVFGGNNTTTEQYSQNQPTTAAVQKLLTDIFEETKPAPARAETLYKGLSAAAGNSSEKTYEKLFEALIYNEDITSYEYPRNAVNRQGGSAPNVSGERYTEPSAVYRTAEKITSPDVSEVSAAKAASAVNSFVSIFNRASEFVENVLGRSVGITAAGAFGAESPSAVELILSDNFTEISRREIGQTFERLIHHIAPNTAEALRAPVETAPAENLSREKERGYSLPEQELLHLDSTAAPAQISRAAAGSAQNGSNIPEEIRRSAAAVLQYSRIIQKISGAPSLRALIQRSYAQGGSLTISSPSVFGDNIRQTLQSFITHGGMSFSLSSAPSEYYRAIFPKSSAGAAPNERFTREIEHYIGGNIILPYGEPLGRYNAKPSAAAERMSIFGMNTLVFGDTPQTAGTLPQPHNAAMGEKLVLKENFTEYFSDSRISSEKSAAARYIETERNGEPLTFALSVESVSAAPNSAEAAREQPSAHGETAAEQPEAALPPAEEIYRQLNIDGDITKLLSSEEALNSYIRNQINSYFSEQNPERGDKMILNSYRSVEIICERVLSKLESRLKTERRLSGR